MVLPDGLQFLKLGWWLIHILAVLLIWSYAYRKGRLDERRERKEAESHRPTPPAVGPEIRAAAGPSASEEPTRSSEAFPG